MAKDRNLNKEVSDIFDGYHPLAIFSDGTLYINLHSVQDQPGMEAKVERLHDLVNTGPEVWQLKNVVTGGYPEPKLKQYVGSRELR